MSQPQVPLNHPATQNSNEPVETKKQTRKSRAPRVLLPKKPPVAIRTLWEWATLAEKEQAHKIAAALMEYWMGQSSKQEIATRLGLPMVRVWQLSQQAMSGMVVGLLHPPKNQTKSALNPEEDPKKLKARIQELEKWVSTQQRLIVILRDMPVTREAMQLREQVVKETQAEAMRLSEKDAKPAKKAIGLRKS